LPKPTLFIQVTDKMLQWILEFKNFIEYFPDDEPFNSNKLMQLPDNSQIPNMIRQLNYDVLLKLVVWEPHVLFRVKEYIEVEQLYNFLDPAMSVEIQQIQNVYKKFNAFLTELINAGERNPNCLPDILTILFTSCEKLQYGDSKIHNRLQKDLPHDSNGHYWCNEQMKQLLL